MSSMQPTLNELPFAEALSTVEEEARSGVLSWTGDDERGELVYSRGRLLSVYNSGWTRTLADHLRAGGVLDEWDAVGDSGAPLETLLANIERAAPQRKGLADRADTVVSSAMRDALLMLMADPPATFSFDEAQISAAPPRHADDTRLVLARGLRLSEPEAPVNDDEVRLIVVDDDAGFRTRFMEESAREGVIAESLTGARAAVRALGRLQGRPDRRMLVDLVMPRANGRGILGGLEVVRRAADAGVSAQLVLLLEDDHPDAQAHAEGLGVTQIMRKPESARGMRALVHRLVPKRTESESAVDLVGQLRAELGASAQDWTPDPGLALDENAQSLETLRSLLAQVNDPAFEEEIPLLLLRFAAEYFSRGALLLHDRERETLVGQGGFGLSSPDPGRTVHALRIPLGEDSIFSKCVAERTGSKTRPQPGNAHDGALLGVLGDPAPEELYVAPLFSPRGLEAVLCADNAADGRAFPDIALLQIFIQQAAVAMERSSLVKEVQSLRPTPSSALSGS